MLRINDIEDGLASRDNLKKISTQLSNEYSRTLLEEGDIALAVVGTIGRSLIVDEGLIGCNLSRAVAKVRPGNGLSSHVLRWIFESLPFKFYTDLICVGTAQRVLNMNSLASFSIAIPSTPEQVSIDHFLDLETAKIDALIAEQKRLIQLLQEKRQAVVSHAVTKGLNQNAPMKDSGVEWLGEVPEHWEVAPLKRLASIQTGITKGKDYEDKQTISVPYLRVANVQDGWIDLTDVAMIEIPPDDLARYTLQPGDVLMNEGGDYDKLGRGAVWNGEIRPCITQNHVFAVRPCHIEPEWLNKITSSSYAQFYFMSRSKQSTNLASISSANLMQLPVVVPPKAERLEILDLINASTSQLDTLLQTATLAIGLLQERRSALISAAVVGQIDVRGFVPETAAA